MVEVTVTFTPENNISSIETEENEGIKPAKLGMLIADIRGDELWLQSPADRKADIKTEATIDL